jgi:hypothetical protein
VSPLHIVNADFVLPCEPRRKHKEEIPINQFVEHRYPCARRSTNCMQRVMDFVRLITILWTISELPCADGLHHMKMKLPKTFQRDIEQTTLTVTNKCQEDIYPGVSTQAGQGPKTSGFKLTPGDQKNLTVSGNWQGRIWGRTNCSFNDDGTGASNNGGSNGGGRACSTGDCNGVLDCIVTVRSSDLEKKLYSNYPQGDTPVTLAEFTLEGSGSQTYYDISLVDGYNIPMAIVMNPSGNSTLADIPPNLTNPSCQGTAVLLAPTGYNPYSASGNGQTFLGTNSSYPLPFDDQTTDSQVQRWCPWDLQASPPTKPGDGVYPYPDDSIQRPAFNPCFSACAKWNKPSDCCTGDHGTASTCSPSLYSKAAKAVCPDAYSYGT